MRHGALAVSCNPVPNWPPCRLNHSDLDLPRLSRSSSVIETRECIFRRKAICIVVSSRHEISSIFFPQRGERSLLKIFRDRRCESCLSFARLSFAKNKEDHQDSPRVVKSREISKRVARKGKQHGSVRGTRSSNIHPRGRKSRAQSCKNTRFYLGGISDRGSFH